MAKGSPVRRMVFAGIAVAAGGALIVFELSRPAASGPGERWFWLAVGALAVVLGVIELLANVRRER